MDLISFYELKSLLLQKGQIKLRVASNSMFPVLKENEIISVEKCVVADLKTFDIIVFWDGTRLISHFLWVKQLKKEALKYLLITKSIKDPLNIDLPIEEDLILGKVNVKIPVITKISISLRNFFKSYG